MVLSFFSSKGTATASSSSSGDDPIASPPSSKSSSFPCMHPSRTSSTQGTSRDKTKKATSFEDVLGVPTTQEHAYEDDPEGCEALVEAFTGTWQECFKESQFTQEKEKYLEHLGWSWFGRKLASQIGDQVQIATRDKASHTLTHTPKQTAVLKKLQSVVGVPASVTTVTSGAPYESFDWPAQSMACGVKFDVARKTMIIRKRLIGSAAAAATASSSNRGTLSPADEADDGGTSSPDEAAQQQGGDDDANNTSSNSAMPLQAEAAGAQCPHSLKYDYEGYWEQRLHEDGTTVSMVMKNTFTHKIKPNKRYNADWVLVYKKLAGVQHPAPDDEEAAAAADDSQSLPTADASNGQPPCPSSASSLS